ncbi:hypothetical protein [Methylobacterium oxalidis]|uniref:Uncharacterized protein n=2 Tax=Methylobacterium oxalidis TaxID=944322 RepID=A0A512IX43_9HYPH|nr:hypothetical protein [Methylobacterium oxalidis]GEP02282.1 hypothetical protein MOX02_03200 [Methylobacterium oxalidis]GJE32272.1 hypothetical protein LDDCCGHA_2458 [Methylobacterium oxalidis]GLS62227.1 hypothetical protein GCM10007888_06080 [Methylobacterium oxalidis]
MFNNSAYQTHNVPAGAIPQRGWKARRANAEDRRAERLDDLNDPYRQAIRRCRHLRSLMQYVKADAAAAWNAENGPVPCPITGKPAAMHPQKAAALAAFLEAQGWGSDPMAPITPTRPLAEIEAAMSGGLLAEIAEADVALAELEGRDPAVPAPAPVAAAPAAETKRGPSRSHKPEPTFSREADEDADNAYIED